MEDQHSDSIREGKKKEFPIVKKNISNKRRKLKKYFDLLFSNGLKINALQALPFWIASILVGLIAFVYTRLFSLTEDILRNVLHWHSWMIFIMAPFFFMLALMTVRLFAPNAKGSGIPQVMAAIELSTPKYESRIYKLLSLRIILTKIASSIMMVLGGGAIGREGPTIQIAGSVFRLVNKNIPNSWPKLSKQSFILTGAAAGLAAAFNTPLGGVVFAMEELAKIHIRFFRTALFTAVIIAGLTAQALLGPYLYLGYPNVKGVGLSILLAVVITAVIAGVLGSVMCRIILRLLKWKKKMGVSKSFLFALGAGVLIASLAYFFNDEILGSGKDLMNRSLFTDDKVVSWHTVLLRIIGPVISFNTGASGGIFAPALAAGSSVGSFISGMFHYTGSNANIIILSGMVGFLTGVTRTPFTSAILVLEMTDRHSVIFHLMIAALVSNIVSLLIDKHSFYEQLKKEYVEETINENKSPVVAPSIPASPEH